MLEDVKNPSLSQTPDEYLRSHFEVKECEVTPLTIVGALNEMDSSVGRTFALLEKAQVILEKLNPSFVEVDMSKEREIVKEDYLSGTFNHVRQTLDENIDKIDSLLNRINSLIG